MSKRCNHNALSYDSSSHVVNTKFKRIEEDRRLAATQTSGQIPEDLDGLRVLPSTFPAPLILPGDDLACDGRYPPQSVRSWVRGEFRNEVTQDRQTIYVVGPPEISHEVAFIRAWSEPQLPLSNTSSTKKTKQPSRARAGIVHPRIADIVQYFGAFFHGMQVQTVDHSWRFAPWVTSNRPQRKEQREAVALETSDSAIRIRTRPSLDGCFERQLNLSDLLDACLDFVPQDAYALLLLVEQDMFEDEEDDFCCGRAFGGSRVAVVSTARYHPLLDDEQGIDREHAWPASHCSAYMEACCCEGSPEQVATRKPPKARSSKLVTCQDSAGSSAMHAALESHAKLPSLTRNPSSPALNGLWLGRVCKTAAHEVGHCLGMDHCVYYGCLMQGTANVCEDARQPPYLCPVDLAKFTTATGTDMVARYEALLAFCDERRHVQLFAAFAAWLRVRLMEASS